MIENIVPWAAGVAAQGFQSGVGHYVLQGFVGAFFASSGFHKLFNPAKHAQMVRAMEHAHCRPYGPMAWWVSSVEFFGGLALVANAAVGFAAAALLVVIGVAWLSQVRGVLAKGAPYTGWPIFGKCAAVFCMAESIYAAALAAILLG